MRIRQRYRAVSQLGAALGRAIRGLPTSAHKAVPRYREPGRKDVMPDSVCEGLRPLLRYMQVLMVVDKLLQPSACINVGGSG